MKCRARVSMRTQPASLHFLIIMAAVAVVWRANMVSEV